MTRAARAQDRRARPAEVPPPRQKAARGSRDAGALLRRRPRSSAWPATSRWTRRRQPCSSSCSAGTGLVRTGRAPHEAYLARAIASLDAVEVTMVCIFLPRHLQALRPTCAYLIRRIETKLPHASDPCRSLAGPMTKVLKKRKSARIHRCQLLMTSLRRGRWAFAFEAAHDVRQSGRRQAARRSRQPNPSGSLAAASAALIEIIEVALK